MCTMEGFFVKVANLNGMKVITSEAQVLGEVEGTEIDVVDWKVTHLHISLTKAISEKFNFKKPLLGSVMVGLPIETVKAVGDVVSLNKSIEDLKYMSEFKVQQ
jgi:sporulation protein YlmC with PRC-barrel domain